MADSRQKTAPLMDLLAERNREKPLAEKLRPASLDDYLGQTNVVGEGTPLRNLIESEGGAP